MKTPALFTLLLLTFLTCGCESPEPTGNVIILVPGVAGDVGYDALLDGLKDGGVKTPVMKVSWGAPSALFFLNFTSQSIHNSAEEKLSDRIASYAKKNPGARIDLIGHSAGCGVVLGALRRLPDDLHAHNVVLLAPSVSPGYDVANSAKHVTGSINAFHSDQDTLFLSWRTSNFGTYDGIKSRAAGNAGFDPQTITSLNGKLIDHAYDPSWKELGNNGGHFDCLAREFIHRVVASELKEPSDTPPQPALSLPNGSTSAAAAPAPTSRGTAQ